ncbi:reverse transcriptase domain-containing protein [Bacillus sinesaloumensis]|uniref:reverse transcriptase domain-containing protein n=1 Tax=Litchfieldia sinesaloumensis TaxID=1926280 RepID=UPI000988377B|nr:reverse transcriptase domain-containing protein [Bacillus sinesaloumensis]
MDGEYDYKLKEIATEVNIKRIFREYEESKKDNFYDPPKIRIQIGTDGVDHVLFRKNLDINCINISRRIKSGNYFFKPFREIHIPKGNGQYRTISIASISDILVQKLIHECIYPYAETMFRELHNTSFAYRKGISAPQAAKQVYKYIKSGYSYVFDADISKFFDTIPHDNLKEKLFDFCGEENKLIYTYLKRFISVDRVLPETYIYHKEKEKIFKRKKPKRIKRKAGIPQGGVFSGLIANIYMHEFDKWIIGLKEKYDLKYIRYADDFLVLYKDKNIEEKIKNEISCMIEKLGLNLNWDKTKTIDLTKKGNYVNFVGFSISQTGIRIKKENMNKFKQKVLEVIKKNHISNYEEKDLKRLISKLKFKLLGNEALGLSKCNKCNLFEPKRSWLSYFSILTDVQQLRELDAWIRKQLYVWHYNQSGNRLSLKKIREFGHIRLEDIYRRIKKEEKLEIEYCKCSPLEAKRSREYLFHILIFHES